MCYLCNFYYHFIVEFALCQLANSQINAVDIKLGLINGNLMPTRAKKRFFYHYQRCASYSGTLNCPGLLLPGTRDTHLRFRDSPGHYGTVGHPL